MVREQESGVSASADSTPMWPNGLMTRVCRTCSPPQLSTLPACDVCGRTTEPIVVYNTPRGEARVRWGLTAREAEVVQHVAEGLTNALIAKRLVISEKTVKELLARARQKMGAENRMQAAHMWWEAQS